MPELPEVETVRRGITPVLLNQRIHSVIIRQPKLRYIIPSHLKKTLPGLKIHNIIRRSKYLLFETELGHLIIHLGMSGRIHVLPTATAVAKHDHVDINFENGICLRYHDPRRFGMILWTPQSPAIHPLLMQLGPEPLSIEFDGDHLFRQSRTRKICIKQFIMDSKVVVGVGNIYASESLFHAGISPKRAANKISRIRYHLLADHIKNVLNKAIKAGGTTLKDFSTVDGNPGYFQQELFVYGRENKSCFNCGEKIKKIIQGQRSTFFCHECQH